MYELSISFTSLPVSSFRPFHCLVALPESDQKRKKNPKSVTFKKHSFNNLLKGLIVQN